MKDMLAAAVLLCGAAVRRVRGGVHLGSGLGRIGIVHVRHGSLVAKMYSELTKIRTRRRAADSTDSTARRDNAVLVFVNSLYFGFPFACHNGKAT